MDTTMTAIKIYQTMCDIVIAEYEECKARLETVPKESRGERKALHIELGMYNVCLRAGLLYSPDVESVLQKRRHFLKRALPDFPALAAVFHEANDEAQLKIVAALGGDLFMKTQFVNAYQAELTEAQHAGDAQSVFELNIKLGAIRKVLQKWEDWRVRHNVCPNLTGETTI